MAPLHRAPMLNDVPVAALARLLNMAPHFAEPHHRPVLLTSDQTPLLAPGTRVCLPRCPQRAAAAGLLYAQEKTVWNSGYGALCRAVRWSALVAPLSPVPAYRSALHTDSAFPAHCRPRPPHP